MKKSKFLLPCVVCAATAMIILLASCSKSGSTGPAGPAGATGPAGSAGPAGPAGTANVIYSPWIDTATYFLDTTHVGAVIDSVYFTDLSVPKLTADILSNGELKVYINLNTADDPVVFPLPYNDGTVRVDVLFATNTIEVSSNVNISGLPLRYILIPGGTAARSAKTIDWNNYAAVKAYLKLKD